MHPAPIGAAGVLVTAGLQPARDPREHGQRPGPGPDLAGQDDGQGHVEHQVAEVVADPVDDLAVRRAAAGPAREIAIGAVEHVPAEVEDQPREGGPGPGQQQIAGGRRTHGPQAHYRHDVRGDPGGDQQAGHGARERMDDVVVQQFLDFARTSAVDGRWAGRADIADLNGDGIRGHFRRKPRGISVMHASFLFGLRARACR